MAYNELKLFNDVTDIIEFILVCSRSLEKLAADKNRKTSEAIFVMYQFIDICT